MLSSVEPSSASIHFSCDFGVFFPFLAAEGNIIIFFGGQSSDWIASTAKIFLLLDVPLKKIHI